MRIKNLKTIVFIFLFISSFLAINSCGKSPIENAIEDLIDAGDDNEDDNDVNNNDDEDDNDGNNDNDEDEPKPSFTANVNDTEFVATTLISQSLTGASINIGNAGYNIGITGQYLSTDLKSIQIIILYVFGADFDELSAGSEFNAIGNILGTQVPGAFAIYGSDPDTDIEDDNFGTDTLEEISIKITTIDKEKKLISGEFNFIAVDDDTELKYEVNQGVFTNLEYIIQ